MSKLSRFKQLQAQLEQAQAEHDALQQDPTIQRMQEAATFLRESMAEYELSLEDVVELLRPGHVIVKAGSGAAAAKPARRQRTLMVYTNPHSGEVVETRGGNNKTLRQWRERWGDAVSGWGVAKG